MNTINIKKWNDFKSNENIESLTEIKDVKNEFKNEYINLTSKLNILKNELIIAIENLGDNENINRFGDKGFVMNFRDVKDKFSPSYYDFKIQYKVIADYIRNNTQLDFMDSINKILSDGQVKDKAHGMVKLNPVVINRINNLLK